MVYKVTENEVQCMFSALENVLWSMTDFKKTSSVDIPHTFEVRGIEIVIVGEKNYEVIISKNYQHIRNIVKNLHVRAAEIFTKSKMAVC